MRISTEVKIRGVNPRPSTIIKMKTKIGRNKYFNTLTRVGTVVDETIDKYLNEDEFGEYKRIMYEPMFEKKRGNQKLRSTLTYLSHCALANKNLNEPINEDLSKLMTSTEFQIWSEYMVNWIFDNKGQVNDPLVRKKTAVATKSFLEDAIKISEQVGEDYPKVILNTSSNVTKSFAKEFILGLSNSELLNGPFEKYLKLYEIDYGIPGIGETFAQCVDLAAIHAKKGNSLEAKKLREIFLKYGVIHEILNGLGDFAIGDMTTDKVSADQFSDIRNGVLTPVIWQMYNHSNKEDQRFMEDCVGEKELLEEERHRLVKMLFNTGTYDFISKKIKRTGRKLKRDVKNLNFHNEGGSQLQQLISVLESNKIYCQLNENLNEIEKIPKIKDLKPWYSDVI